MTVSDLGDVRLPRVRARAVLARPDWDVIVIGSGVGSLTCAALLARAGRRVLVLERHYELGGLSQSFRRRRLAFEVGVHYVGSVGPGSLLRRAFDEASEGRVRWAPLPSRHDRVRAPGVELRFGGDVDAWRAQLLEATRGEALAIDRVLEASVDAAREGPRYFLERALGAPARLLARHPFRRTAERTTLEALVRAGCSPWLTDLFTYAWGDYGARRERSSFAMHAMTFAHYLGGAYHPRGGGRALARAIASTVHARGGALVVRAGVSAVLVRDGRAYGVALEDGTEVRAPIVVSGAGARTSARLLGPHGAELAALAQAVGPSEAHVALYLALDGAPEALGLDGTNHWLGRDGLVTEARDVEAWLAGGQDVVPGLFVSTACGADPESPSRREDASAIVASISVPSDDDLPLGSADPSAHAALRARLARGMRALLAPALPAVEAAVVHEEISLPRTTTRYTGHAGGEAYGLAATPSRFAAEIGPRVAGVEGLFLTGQDVFVSGVAGAATGGLLTATAILGRLPW